MYCREANKLLSLYLDNLLNEGQARTLEEHATGCEKCNDKLELMKQIPEALQSDKLLAPSEDFTKLVMQRIVMRQAVVKHEANGSFSSYTQTQVTLVSMRTPQAPRKSLVDDEAEAADETEGDLNPTNIVSFEAKRKVARHIPTAYLLRFSAAAAAFVFGFGMLAYMFQLNGFSSSTSDTSGKAVVAFADLLTNSFASPWEVLVGSIVAVVIVVALWLTLVRMRSKTHR